MLNDILDEMGQTLISDLVEVDLFTYSSDKIISDLLGGEGPDIFPATWNTIECSRSIHTA